MIKYRRLINYFFVILLIFIAACAKYENLNHKNKYISYLSIAKIKESEYLVTIKGSEDIKYKLSYSKSPYKLVINIPLAELDPSVLKYSYSDNKIEGVAIYPTSKDVTIEVLLKEGADYIPHIEGGNLSVSLKFAETVGVLAGVGSDYKPIEPIRLNKAKALYDLNLSENKDYFVLDLIVKGVVRFDYGYLEDGEFYIDIYDVDNFFGAKTQLVEGLVKKIRVGDYTNPKKVRVLLELTNKVPLYVAQDGTVLKISNVFSKVPEEVIYIMKFSNIRVKHYQSLLFKLSKSISFKKRILEGKLIIEFDKKVIPVEDVKTLIYFEEPGPFKGYKILTRNEKTSIIVEPADEVYALADRTPDGLVITGSFEPFSKAEEHLKERGVDVANEEKSNENDLITLNIKDMDVREAIRLIYFGKGKNLIFSNDVKGTATLFVDNVPYRTALNIILNENNLVAKEEGNIIWIMTEAKYQNLIASMERGKEEEVRQIAEQPLVTEVVPVNFSMAEEIKPIAELMLSDRGRLVVNERINSYIVTDIPHAIENLKKLLLEVDTPTRQVMIEARIVEVTDTDNLNLGIQWGGKFAKPGITNKDFPSSIIITGDTFHDQEGISGNGYITNFPFQPDEGGVGNLAMTLGSVSNRYNLDLALQALEAQDKIRIISAPRVTTLDNKEAEINSGSTAVIVPTGDNTQAEEVDTGIRLTVTPHITSNNMVFMNIEVEKSSLGQVTANTVTTDEKKATTQVLLSDGETTVIGGILENETQSHKEGWPILSKIPILGFFFRGQASSGRKQELMVFLTPRIVTKVNKPANETTRIGGLK
jgi:type IV pilus assembly protein PilQ